MTQVTIVQALLIAAWVAFWRGTSFGNIYIAKRPIVTALAVGIILGKVPQAMVIGAAVQLIYMGILSVGGNTPADDTIACAVAVTVGVTSGITPSQAVVIAVPVGLISNYLTSIRFALNSVFIHMADGYATRGDTKGIARSAMLYPFIASFLLYFVPVAIAIYEGPTAVSALVSVTPARVMHALAVVGGALPAIGFALTIFVVGRRNLLLYFVAAFFLALSLQSLNIGMIVYAILGVTIAYLHVLFTTGTASKSWTDGGDKSV